jgi:hypothetical protein
MKITTLEESIDPATLNIEK